MTLSRRVFLFGSASVPALALTAGSARAWSTQDVGPTEQSLMAARCTPAPHDNAHLQKALDLLGQAGVPIPLTTAQACPLCGCTIQPG
ncbi:hypothetical protein D3874_09460 [Oleomonas cavernae]|uniref:Uncharacterized protein n=1 Tax=Oleomonas cavernae TaxID=2320859 RepID=A0A418WBC0_9PROT|nr:hypothetical protein [Oleomonas cavernae]RJF87228.1 hypothetical protein D3874_09460 [Oleomonas cavernae]